MAKGKYPQRLESQCPLSCPVLKKGNPTIFTNYRDISLHPIAYKVLTGVLCEQLSHSSKHWLNSFRTGKSTIDQIFALLQILEKTYDSPKSDRVFAAMFEVGIPAKLIRLCRITFSNFWSSVKIEMDLSEPSEISDTRSLHLRHGEYCVKGESVSQWHYLSEKFPVASTCRRYRHHRSHQARCNCCL